MFNQHERNQERWGERGKGNDRQRKRQIGEADRQGKKKTKEKKQTKKEQDQTGQQTDKKRPRPTWIRRQTRNKTKQDSRQRGTKPNMKADRKGKNLKIK